MGSLRHLSESDLMRFAANEMTDAAAAETRAHLATCAHCQGRLDEFRNAFAAYDEYHFNALKPRLDTSTAEWPSLHSLLEKTDTPKRRFVFNPWLLWAEAALALCLVLLGLYLHRDSTRREMHQLLARSAAVPEIPRSRLRLTAGGRSWYRPTVLRTGNAGPGPISSMDHVQGLFIKAGYDWTNPLSARSFADWRDRLRQKRDRVTAIRSEDGQKRFYRLQTQTPKGTLRVASLTLRADTFRPVNAAFHFDDQENIAMTDAGEMPNAAPRPAVKPHASVLTQKLREVPVSPEDELRVFAALNAIGADVGEQVSVAVDGQRNHIVVTGMGISSGRQQQIREALRRLPYAKADFNSAHASVEKNGNDVNGYVAGVSEPFRRALEQRAGGPQQLESITDHALEASNTLLQHAHALAVLAQHFPVAAETRFSKQSREILSGLRHRHALAIEQADLQLGHALQPLLPSRNTEKQEGETPGPSYTSWQFGALQLQDVTRTLDGSVSRLLGGNESPIAGHGGTTRLSNEMKKVSELARAQAAAP